MALLITGPLIGLIVSLVSRLAIVQLFRRFGVTEAGNICSGTIPSKFRCLIELLLSLLMALALIWMLLAWFISLPSLLGAFLTIVGFHLVATLRAVPEYRNSTTATAKKSWTGVKSRLRRILSFRPGNASAATADRQLELTLPVQQPEADALPQAADEPPVTMLADLVKSVEEAAGRLAAAVDDLKAKYQDACEFAKLVAAFQQFSISRELQTALDAESRKRQQTVTNQALLVSQERLALEQRNQALESARSGQTAANNNPQATLDRATAVLGRAEELLSQQQK
jgi:hypothetical protein